jgi:hypothetical protein
MELPPQGVSRSAGGLATAKSDDLSHVHPLQPLQANVRVCPVCTAPRCLNPVTLQDAKNAVVRQREILAATYGKHVPLRMQIESEILSQFRRLPSLPSSMLGLETLAGRDTKLDVADVFGG